MKLKTLNLGDLVVVLAPLILVLVVKFGFHEMWKDEWQAWFLSRDLGLMDLLNFLYYEGHPALWYLYLKPFAFAFPEGDIGLKIAHSIALIFVAYQLYKLDLPIWLKALIGFSYPFLFEYAVISRGYILVIALALYLIKHISSHRINWSAVGIGLFILCQSEVQGVLLAATILLLIFLFERPNIKWPLIGAATGFLIFVLTVFPRTSREELSNAYAGGFFELDNWLKSFQGLTSNVFLPGIIPDANVYGTSSLGIIMGLVVLTAIAYVLRSQGRSLVIFASFWTMSFLFHSMIYPGGLRQWMMVGVVFILSLLFHNGLKGRSDRILLVVLLMPMCVHGIRGVISDIQGPFTNAKMTGLFIKEKVPVNVPVVAINKFECTPVVGYSGREVYALPDGLPFTFFKWVERVYLPSEEELRLFMDYKKVGGLVLLSPYELDDERYPSVRKWQSFDAMNMKNERYHIYLLDR